MKEIGKRLKIDDLEFYAARHSWATIALNKVGVDKYTVHAALNHIDEAMKVTDIYIERDFVNENNANINCKKQEFELLNGPKLKKWVKNKVKDMKGVINEDALNLLIDYVGSDLFRMENEIIKLVNYSSNISLEDVKKLVRNKDEVNIFETIDSITRKDKKGALKSIKKHLDKGDAPTYILAMIGFQIRKIISAKERGSYNNFTIDELKRLYDKIVELDYGIKTGKVNPAESLNILICGV